MARKAKAKKNYPKRQPALLIPFTLKVAEMMKGNPNFTDPAVDPDDLTKSANILLPAYNNRKNGLAAKEAYKTALANTVALLDEEADYVSSVANGNLNVIVSANFEPTKTFASRKTTPQSPKAPVLENVNGELSVSTETVKGATSYCWLIFIGAAHPVGITGNQINLKTSSNLIIIPAGSTRECVRGLTRSTEVTVQVLAQNSAGKSALSPAVSIGIA